MKSDKITAGNAETISKQLTEIMFKMNSENGTIGRLIQDSSIVQNLEQTMENLKNSSKGLDENMKAAKESFLLKGYLRRKEKEAGKAMNDSTGIKSEEQKENNKKKK